MSENHALTIHPIKAKFGLKKDYLTTIKNGCLIFEFIPTSQLSTNSQNTTFIGQSTRNFNWENKEIFVIDPKKCANILLIDPIKKEDFNLNFSYLKDGSKKSLNITPDWKSSQINISFSNVHQATERQYTSDIQVIDFLLIQKMIDYSLPFMMGWNILENSKLANEDIINN